MVRRARNKKGFIRNEKLKKVLWFLIKFNILAIPLYLTIYFNLSYPPMQVFIATISSSFLNFLGYSFLQDGFLLSSFVENELFQVEVSWDSTGWKSMYAIIALVLATPTKIFKNKIIFLLLGIPAIFLLNFIRIISTIILSVNLGLQYFEFLHLFLWRIVVIISVLTIWYVFLVREKHNIS